MGEEHPNRGARTYPEKTRLGRALTRSAGALCPHLEKKTGLDSAIGVLQEANEFLPSTDCKHLQIPGRIWALSDFHREGAEACKFLGRCPLKQ